MAEALKTNKTAVIGMDPYSKTIKLTLETDSPDRLPEFIEESFPEIYAVGGDYGAAVEYALNAVNVKRGSIPPQNATVVIPACAVAVDYITIPSIKHGKISEAFDAEFKLFYQNHEKLLKSETAVVAGRIKTTYRLVMVRKDFIDSVREAAAKHKLGVRAFVPEHCAVADAAYRLYPQLKKSPCIIADIRKGHSVLVVCGKDVLLGAYALPFGWETLCGDAVTDEASLFRADAAELAIINAKEKAKALKLTSYINNITANDTGARAESAADENDEDMTDEMSRQNGKHDEAETDEDYEDDDGDIMSNSDETKSGVKVKRKNLRRLPKYMLRPLPENREDFIMENFRNIQKRILLVARECALTAHYPKIETVCLNLPHEFEMIAARLNAEKENSLHWVNIPDKNNLRAYSEGLCQYTVREIKNTARFPVF